MPIVGIGASAGWIEALKTFFEAMPADSGLAFVVVLHLDPTQASDLAPLLDDYLGPDSVAAHGLLEPGLVQGYLGRFRRGDPSVAQKVWLLLAFQMWQRRWMQ